MARGDDEQTVRIWAKGGFKQELADAYAVREEVGLRGEAASKDGLELHQILCERIGFKGGGCTYLDPSNTGTELKVKCRTGGA